MITYYHVNTAHANYGDFIAEAEGIHNNKTGHELSITMNVAGTEAIVKVHNGLIACPEGLIINSYTKETHSDIFSFFYTSEWQAPE